MSHIDQGRPSGKREQFDFGDAGVATDNHRGPRFFPALPSHPTLLNRFRHVLTALLLCAGYYFAAELSFALRVPSTRSSIIWAPNAILLVALLLTPVRSWWIWLLAALPAHLFAQSYDQKPVLVLLCPFLANVAQAIITSLALRRFIDMSYRLDTLRSMSLFILVAVIAVPAVVSFLAADLFVFAGWETDYWLVARARFLSNVTTGLTIAPLILTAATIRLAAFKHVRTRTYLEFLLLTGALAGTLYVSTALAARGLGSIPLELYAPLPFMLWAAVRFGPSGLCLSLLFVVAHSISETINGRGAYSSQSPAENVLALQISLAVLATPLMLLAALIEERRSKAKALRESEERHRSLAETATDAILTIDENSTIVFANSAVEKLFGYKPSELVGRRITALMPESLRRHHEEGLRSYLQRGEKGFSWGGVSFPGLHKSGHEISLEVSLGEYKLGESRFFTGIVRDVSERKRTQEALHESEERLRRTEQFSLVMVTHTDLEGRWLKVPSRLCELLGYTEQELLGMRFQDVTYPDDLEPNTRQRLRLMRGEIKAFDLEKRYIRKDGEIVWIDLNVSVVRGDDGKPVHFRSYIRDITEGKRTEAALRESEARFKLALEAGQMGVWDSDLRNNRLHWSKEVFTILGLVPFSVEPARRIWADRVHPEDLPDVLATRDKAIAERSEYKKEYRVIWPDGTTRWVVTRAKPIYSGDDSCARVMGFIVDVTERKLAEEEIKRLKDRLQAENVYLREEVSRAHGFGRIIGRSEAMRRVLKQAEQVAPTDTTVLICGETGTGKELIARAIHAVSKRKDRPLIKVNCAALPASLIESELFGHEKGAFTGAASKRVGRFELADGATIFLDEIGELPLDLQVKLLRVLQEGEFERLGSSRTIKVSVRVIAATNRELRAAVREGRFREDLYYRLHVYPIDLPPLREHKEDIGDLAAAFLVESERRLGRSFSGLSEGVLSALRNYKWPGNVRELQNVIERAAVRSTGRALQLPQDWEAVNLHDHISSDQPAGGTRDVLVRAETESRELSLLQMERAHILAVLERTHWRIEGARGAAVILGMNPSTLRSRMNKLGIRRLRKAAENQNRPSDAIRRYH
jgi:formate hydrogenlyase transcriptional activator